MYILIQLIQILTLLYILISVLFVIGLFIRRVGHNEIQYTVSVIIAARNEEDNISPLLTDLVHQTYPKQLYEVIVVNDGSSDKTAEIVLQYAHQHNHFHLFELENIPSEYSPKKFAMTKGISKSRGEIILTADADCRVKPTWIEAMVGYFSPQVGMVVGFSQFGRKKEKHSFFENLQATDFLQLMAAAAGSCSLGILAVEKQRSPGFPRMQWCSMMTCWCYCRMEVVGEHMAPPSGTQPRSNLRQHRHPSPGC